MQGEHRGAESKIEPLRLWDLPLQCGILRVNLCLGICQGGAGSQPCNEVGATSPVAPVGSTLFDVRRERKVETRSGRQEAETWREHSDDRPGAAIHAQGTPENARVGVEAFSPVSVSNDRHAVGLGGCFLFFENASDSGADTERREELR